VLTKNHTGVTHTHTFIYKLNESCLPAAQQYRTLAGRPTHFPSTWG